MLDEPVITSIGVINVILDYIVIKLEFPSQELDLYCHLLVEAIKANCNSPNYAIEAGPSLDRSGIYIARVAIHVNSIAELKFDPMCIVQATACFRLDQLFPKECVSRFLYLSIQLQLGANDFPL